MTDRTTRALSVSAIVCSLAALGVVALQWSVDGPNRLNAERIEELERELAYLRGASIPPGENLDAERPRDPELPPSRIGSFEAGRLSSDPEVEEMRWTMTVRGFMPATPEHVERSKSLISDTSQDIQLRVAALRVLWRTKNIDDEVARAAIGAFHSTDDLRAQEDILELLDGVTTPELAPTLLTASANSPSYRVRRQALDAMSGFLPDPKLEDWLRIVKKNDVDRRVREEAERLLKKFGSSGSE